ncbi:CoxG family protein [Halobaculum magnesiiphilum]|uniref:Carbon monoxide dehydrogenase n=1 Tax=Halobaculum magnesiiphilum TaxID=1017351 RepID=A0A8T8WI21_9EURY|nr:SRPBCC domain-containing protein [Halobaculum magnesiiphilum]QZP39487.1 carbon monoxide dehydrogenase [Halobaculum magnesiiphilum]
MNFNGTFELEDTTVEEVWLALSDPVLIADSLPGCEFLLHVESDDVDFEELSERASEREEELTGDPETIAERAFREGEWYAGLVQVSVGPVNPTFETVVRIDERDQPRMHASGEGTSGDSSFEMSSGMELHETDDGGVAVEWETEADVFGKVAGMGQRVINPVANRIVKRFFSGVQSTLRDLQLSDADTPDPDEDDEGEDRGIVDRLLGRSSADSS